jgi:Tol biopolymer transport system component
LIVLAFVAMVLAALSTPVLAKFPPPAHFALSPVASTIRAISRISVDSNGAQGNNWSNDPCISADGRYVAFSSVASNLVSGDTNGAYDVFVHDTLTESTVLVSVNSYGEQGNGFSGFPSISADGRYIAFFSSSDNLVGGDNNYANDIFLRDMQTGITTRLSVHSSGTEGNGESYFSSISADGRYVAFDSYASNLVNGDTNGKSDIFLRDTQAGTTTRLSVDSNGVQGNGDSYGPSISVDGRNVAFESTASNLVSNDTNGASDIFVRDTNTGTTTRLSITSSGAQGNGNSSRPTISANGRYVAFESKASNLVSGDTNNTSDVFLRDTQTVTTTRLSVTSSGVEGNYHSEYASISADGRYVTFSSSATNLVSGITNEIIDIFLRDIQTGLTTRLSLAWNGTEGNGPSIKPRISANGHYVVFVSDATNLVSGDTNGMYDVFIVPVTKFISWVYLPIVIR